MSDKRRILMFSCALVTLLMSMSIMNGNVQIALAQKPGALTFWTIIFSGIKNGHPVINTTKTTLNGTLAQMRQQMSSVADKVYTQALKIVKGPTVFWGGKGLNETSVLLTPTKSDFRDYINSAINTEANSTAIKDDRCWIMWVGGGMHGSCPSEK